MNLGPEPAEEYVWGGWPHAAWDGCMFLVASCHRAGHRAISQQALNRGGIVSAS